MAITDAGTAGLGQRRRRRVDGGSKFAGGGRLLSACQVVLDEIWQGVIELALQGIEILAQRRQ